MNQRFEFAVLLDLDGTLIDSVADLTAATNRILTERGLDELSVDQVRTMIGNGMSRLVERAFLARGVQLDAKRLADETHAVVSSYESDLHSNTVLLPGAWEAIRLFQRAGWALAVVTNKPQRATEQILAHFGLDTAVNLIVGGDRGIAPKPAADMLLHALKYFGVARQQALMVGDSPADVGAARNAGIVCAVVRGGYTKSDVSVDTLGADHVLDSLLELRTDLLCSN